MLPKLTNRSSTATPAIRDGRYVVVDWNDSSIAIHQMNLSKDEAVIERSLFEQWPASVGENDSAEATGEWLNQLLQKHTITATDTIVSVPRRQVSLKLLEFPNVDDDELASLIEMQVEAQLDVGAPEQPFDFLPQPVTENADNRHALVATIPAEALKRINDVLTAAGLKLKATCVGELAMDALVPESNDCLTLNILANNAKAEFVTSFDGVPLASHSTRMPANNPAELAKMIPAVVARTIAGLPESLRTLRLVKIHLLGPHATQLQTEVARTNECDVQAIAIPDNHAVRAIAVLTSLQQRRGTINFLSPKRPVDVRQAQRQQWIRYAVGAAVLVGLIALWQFTEKRSLENQLATLTETGNGLTELNERGAATLEEWKFVNEWQSSAVDWSHEIKDFTDHLPDPGKGYLTRLQVDQPSGSRAPVIRADGVAKTADVAMSLNRSLMAADGKYELQPHGIDRATRDSEFQSSFQIEAELQKTAQK